MSFVPPPTGPELSPAQLASSVRQSRRRLRRLGLLGDEVEVDADRLDTWRAELLVHLRSGPRAIGPQHLRRLRHLAPVLYLDGDSALDEIAAQLRRCPQTVPVRTAKILAEFRPDLRDVLRFSAKRSIPLVLGPGSPQSIVQEMSTTVFKVGLPISRAISTFRLNPTSPYAQALLAALTDEPAGPWLWSHSWADLQPFLDQHQRTRLACRLVNSMLLQIFEGVDEPGMVADSCPLGRFIGHLHQHLPTNERAEAWGELSDQARQLLRWWQVQRDLDAAFENWNAEPERRDFWYQYVGSIWEVTAYPRVATILIRIGDWYFVEVGRTGFATYLFPSAGAPSLKRALKSASRQTDVRAHHRDFNHNANRMLHHPGWQERFEERIYNLTGRSVDE